MRLARVVRNRKQARIDHGLGPGKNQALTLV
jgi:hypothetical protein